MNSKLLWIILIPVIGLAVAPRSADAQDCVGTGVAMLTAKKHHLSLDEIRPFCVAPGESFMIKIKNPSGTIKKGHVEAKNKSAADPTIEGSNEEFVSKLKVTVSSEAVEGEWYQFLISVQDVGILDPTVKVIPSIQFNAMKVQAVNELLDTLDLTVEDFMRLDNEYKTQ